MAEFELQIVDVGTIPDDGTGDELRTAFILCNTNFSERMAGLVSQGGTVADGNSISLFTPDGDSACLSQHGLVWVTAYEAGYVSDPGHYALFVFDGSTGLTELHKSANASLSTPPGMDPDKLYFWVSSGELKMQNNMGGAVVYRAFFLSTEENL